jgi:carbon storage regulator CsrA
MLVLTRKETESIIIGGDIEVVITRISGNKVRVGVSAPRDIPIYRKEIGPLFNAEYKPVSAQHRLLRSA